MGKFLRHFAELRSYPHSFTQQRPFPSRQVAVESSVVRFAVLRRHNQTQPCPARAFRALPAKNMRCFKRSTRGVYRQRP